MSVFKFQLSQLVLSLVEEDRDLYYKTLEFLKCHDPLVIPLQLFKSGKSSSKFLPPIEKFHLRLYLVYERDITDSEKYEAYKNLDSEQYLTNTFTDKLLVFPLCSGVVIIRTHVTHSQSLSNKPAMPWVALHQTGKILRAFCDCAAGLGSVCIHVSALLQLAVSARQDSSTTADDNDVGIPITSLPCYWNKPGKGPVTLGKIADLDVHSQRKKEVPLNDILEVNDEEQQRTNEALKKLKKLPVVLSCVPEYAHLFQPPAETHILPKALSELYNPHFEGKKELEVNEECERIFSEIRISIEEQRSVEMVTKNQSECEEWEQQRSGRITGTKIHRILKRDPSKELSGGEIKFLLEMCYPQIITFKGNMYTRYGQRNEPKAISLLESTINSRKTHENFLCEPVGLIISKSHPYLAASPDRIFTCICHGRGLVEVKCPYLVKGKSIREYAKNNKGFCLLLDESTNELRLDQNHEYYSQVQLQLFVSELPLAVFVVFNGNKEVEYVTVQRNEDVIAMMAAKGKLYFVNFILPELVAKRYSSVRAIPQTATTSSQKSALSDQLHQFICYCQDPHKIDETIICASSFCVINEFHKSCTGSKRLSKSWMCIFCKKETASRRRKSGPINQQSCASSMELTDNTLNQAPRMNDTLNECETASRDVMPVPDNTSTTKQLQSKSNSRKSLNSASRRRKSGPINQQSCASSMELTDNTLNQAPRMNDTINECETASRDVTPVPDNTSTTKQLQSKSHFNEENVPPQMLPNPSRKRGRPKKITENKNTEINLVNLSQSNRPNVVCVPNKACDTRNVLSDVSSFGMKRKALRLLNE